MNEIELKEKRLYQQRREDEVLRGKLKLGVGLTDKELDMIIDRGLVPPPEQPRTAQIQTPLIPPYKQDIHRPTLILRGLHRGHRWELYAGSRAKVEDEAWEYDLIINLTGQPLGSRKHIIPPGTIPRKWARPLSDREVVLDWPDFGILGVPVQFWRDLIKAIRSHRRTLVFCMGGHGRTGTCISILMAMIRHIPGDKAIEKVRAEYCPKAVETTKQAEYVGRVAQLARRGRGK